VAQHAVALTQLTKKRESIGAKFLLQVPEFHVARGEFVVVVGTSGCGKSTLMDMVALVLRPSSAQTFSFSASSNQTFDAAKLWKNNDEKGLSRIRREVLAYVLQSGGLFPYLSVRENAALPRKLKGLPANKTLMNEIAYSIGLGTSTAAASDRAASLTQEQLISTADYSLLGKKPRFLSGGQRQRSAILRALMSEPAIILADEPTAAVDEITAQNIMHEFKQVARQRNVSVVMVTHDRRLVSGQVDRAYTFNVSRNDDSGQIVSTLVPLPVEQL